MMPIFFHAEAHLWIFYALFFNGFLLNLLFLDFSSQYRRLAKPIEAQLIISFGLSLSFNGLLLLSLDWLGVPFSLAIYVLTALTLICSGLIVLRKLYWRWQGQITWPAMALYALMFVILFYNGGMIDQVSDAWWHMSLANKIGWENSFTLKYGHLTGAPDRYYPLLWHGNLALLRELSGQQLPVIWNAFTAWGGPLKLMAYYLVGLGLFKDRKVAFCGALMFALLPGFGNSYMRVSAWPSHVAYIFWFFSLYLAFSLIDSFPAKTNLKEAAKHLVNNSLLLMVLTVGLVIIFLSHQFEILLFLGAIFVYLTGLSIARIYGRVDSTTLVDKEQTLYIWSYRLGLVVLAISAILAALNLKADARGGDDYIALLLPIGLFFTLFVADTIVKPHTWLARTMILILLIVVLASVNYQHLASLVYPDMALPLSGSREKPVLATGWFGQSLALPGWHLQLRTGLLWSGVVGVIVSLTFAVFSNRRAWVFIASNCVFIWLLCTSPYLYEWFSDVLQYHSTWRFGMLSFHQLAIGALLVWLLQALYVQAFGR